MPAAIAFVSLATTVAGTFNQQKQARRIQRQQQKQENIQAGLAEINNRREVVRRIARERVARASALAAGQARGASGDSAVEGQVGGLRSSLGSDIGQVGTTENAGAQLSQISSNIANIQSDAARTQAVTAISNSIFNTVGGFDTIFASTPKTTTPTPATPTPDQYTGQDINNLVF